MRLFVAIELDDRFKKQLADMQRQLSGFSQVVRWTKPDQMHLTLKFLGDVANERANDVCAAAKRAADQCGAFTLTLSGCGCFPERGRVRVVFGQARDETGTLGVLREALEAAFEELGFAREDRPFAPHLTVGRVRQGSIANGLREAVQAIAAGFGNARPDAAQPMAQTVEAIAVIQSELRPEGARYLELSRHKLAGHGCADQIRPKRGE